MPAGEAEHLPGEAAAASPAPAGPPMGSPATATPILTGQGRSYWFTTASLKTIWSCAAGSPAESYVFKTQTDTGTAALLLDSLYQGTRWPPSGRWSSRSRGLCPVAIPVCRSTRGLRGCRKTIPHRRSGRERGTLSLQTSAAVLSHTKRFFTLEEGDRRGLPLRHLRLLP